MGSAQHNGSRLSTPRQAIPGPVPVKTRLERARDQLEVAWHDVTGEPFPDSFDAELPILDSLSLDGHGLAAGIGAAIAAIRESELRIARLAPVDVASAFRGLKDASSGVLARQAARALSVDRPAVERGPY